MMLLELECGTDSGTDRLDVFDLHFGHDGDNVVCEDFDDGQEGADREGTVLGSMISQYLWDFINTKTCY